MEPSWNLERGRGIPYGRKAYKVVPLQNPVGTEVKMGAWPVKTLLVIS